MSCSKHALTASSKAEVKPKRLRLSESSETVPPQLDPDVAPPTQAAWIASVQPRESWFYTEAIQICVDKSGLVGDESTKLVSTLFVFDSPGYIDEQLKKPITCSWAAF